MIIHLKKNVSAAQAAVLASEHKAFHVSNNQEILITGSGVKELPTGLADFTDNFWVFANDMQLASKNYQSDKRTVAINNTIIGGTTNNTVLIGGPCSVESEEQIRSSAELLVKMGLSTLRGGCYKPRTSPKNMA
jgi:3-deoxy-7-phosphoheptulonate synthase